MIMLILFEINSSMFYINYSSNIIALYSNNIRKSLSTSVDYSSIYITFISRAVVISVAKFVTCKLEILFILVRATLCNYFFSLESITIILILLELLVTLFRYKILIFSKRPEKINAVKLFFIYRLRRALLSFYSLLYNYSKEIRWVNERRVEISFIIICTFVVKLPLYYVHLWLLKAHVERSTTTRVLLAAILLKVGSLILLKIRRYVPSLYVFFISVGIVVPSLLCLVQADMKKIVAIRRVSHISFLFIGIWISTTVSILGAWLIQISHGFLSAILFLILGTISSVNSTRLVYYNNSYSITLLLVLFFNRGAPINLSFVRELLLFFSSTLYSYMLIVLVCLSSFFTCYYNFKVWVSLKKRVRSNDIIILALLFFSMNTFILLV